MYKARIFTTDERMCARNWHNHRNAHNLNLLLSHLITKHGKNQPDEMQCNFDGQYKIYTYVYVPHAAVFRVDFMPGLHCTIHITKNVIYRYYI